MDIFAHLDYFLFNNNNKDTEFFVLINDWRFYLV